MSAKGWGEEGEEGAGKGHCPPGQNGLKPSGGAASEASEGARLRRVEERLDELEARLSPEPWARPSAPPPRLPRAFRCRVCRLRVLESGAPLARLSCPACAGELEEERG